jgi:hypothetical protein
MLREMWILTVSVPLVALSAASATDIHQSPQLPTDEYEINFGPMLEAIPGEPDFLIPVMISVAQPTIGVNLLLTYDPGLLEPYVVAPNLFFQRFNADLSFPGRISINLVTDLPPPPDIPPLVGDTTIAWIQCTVTSDDLGYDLLTHIGFYEDPNTPYPDNSLLLEDGTWIVAPGLSLLPGDVLIIHPLYGDINLNEYPYEIGDAVTFLNYFMGLTEFNRRQYANSDCNRDGIQASIADLVYLLAVVSGDTVLVQPPPEFLDMMASLCPPDREDIYRKGVDNASRYDIVLEEDAVAGGAYFVLEYDEGMIVPEQVVAGDGTNSMDMTWNASGGKLRIAMFDWNSGGCSLHADDLLLRVFYSGDTGYGDAAFDIDRAEFSDNFGRSADYSYRVETLRHEDAPLDSRSTSISISCYPNPSNSAVTFSYGIPSDGDYDIVIYDILGREVRSLSDGFVRAGQSRIVWDGTDGFRNQVASGIYFVRLRGPESSATTKVFMLK